MTKTQASALQVWAFILWSAVWLWGGRGESAPIQCLCFAAVLIGFLGLLAMRKIRRESIEYILRMDELKYMNRGKIDQPEWVKKQWQHEAGNVAEQKARQEQKIERFAEAKASYKEIPK